MAESGKPGRVRRGKDGQAGPRRRGRLDPRRPQRSRVLLAHPCERMRHPPPPAPQPADESRLKILLGLAEHGEMHVSALCALLGAPSHPVSQPAVSHHLTLMRLTGLVTYRREGKNNYYRLESRELCELLEQVFADCGN